MEQDKMLYQGHALPAEHGFHFMLKLSSRETCHPWISDHPKSPATAAIGPQPAPIFFAVTNYGRQSQRIFVMEGPE